MNTLEAYRTALDVMAIHGLDDWEFRFDNAQRRFGICDHRKQRISISKPLTELNDYDEVLDTILHEIAHALVGSRVGHGRQWQIQAREIGAKPIRCYDATKVEQPPHKFIGTCPNCRKPTNRLKRLRVACRDCCIEYNNGRFHEDYLIKWERV